MSVQRVRLDGLLGRALDANAAGRLGHFIVDENSPAIALFAPDAVAQNHAGDWYGEHAGKWLYAASKAAARTQDGTLAANVRRVASYLVSRQQPDGYLGTYAPDRRFTREQPPPQRTWDGAPSQRTWDIWTHSHLILGLLEVHRHFPDSRFLDCARRIGDLCWVALTEGGIDITHLGNHHGMSATVLLDPAVELYFATKERRYLDLAGLVVEQAEGRPELNLLTRALGAGDASEIGTGKAYQLLWNMVGFAKLHRATGDARYLDAASRVWESIRSHHLTLGGGPWGGVGQRSREVFNPAGVFSPYGYVETCSTFAWIQLNRELLAITGEAKYAEEIERTAYNDLLGAQAPNGEDWIYYSFPNGARVFTTYWRCCKSSGAMAIEELPGIAYRATADDEISVNLYGPGEASIALARAGVVRLEQAGRYPFDGAVRLRVTPARAARFRVRVRIPAWAAGASVAVNGAAVGPVEPGTFATLEREWREGDEIALDFPMHPALHRRTHRNVQESVAPDGAAVRQEVMRFDYVALSRGPLAYATGLIDGFKMEETMRWAATPRLEMIEVADREGASIRVHVAGRAPLDFHPYYEAGGREDGAWRITWLQAARESVR
jgi:uncharacterized protein